MTCVLLRRGICTGGEGHVNMKLAIHQPWEAPEWVLPWQADHPQKPPSPHLDLGVAAPRQKTVKVCCHPTCGTLFQQPKLTNIGTKDPKGTETSRQRVHHRQAGGRGMLMASWIGTLVLAARQCPFTLEKWQVLPRLSSPLLWWWFWRFLCLASGRVSL